MIATVLTDNTGHEGLCGEWGLSVHIAYRGRGYLLDTGETDLFLQNARKLHIPVESVEYGVLSHAHYDHSDGMPAFFAVNAKAKFLLRDAAREACYDCKQAPRYIGIKEGILVRYADRIVYLRDDVEISPGVHVLGHRTAGLEKQGERASMFIREGEDAWRPDAFAHEQSLVFETGEGLAVFSSCSHAGADVILREVLERFPGRPVSAMIGGLHLFIRTADEVRALARRMREIGIRRVITGHCTGDAAMAVLKEELGDAVEALYCGKTITFPPDVP